MKNTTIKNCTSNRVKHLLLLLFLVLAGTIVQAQERIINGTLTDNTGSALPGVNIYVKGTTIGTVSDINGKYQIKVPSAEAILVFKYVGYATQEITVGEQSAITLTLKEDLQQLNEVVVIGYGVQKRSDLTGAIASVSAKDLAKTPMTGIDAALQGRAAGVQVNPNSGAPGAGVTVRIRGVSSLSGGNPIWIVDGVSAGANSVNPSDIESMEILKDAASAAIYGANGGNGVVLITTKKGKTGKIEANLNYYHGWQDSPNRINMATGPEFAKMYTEWQATKGLKVFKFSDLNNIPSYDYQDMIFRQSPMDNLDFGVSGGGEKSNFYMGIGYQNNVGVLKGVEYKKLNFRLNSDHKINDWLKVGQTFSFTGDKNTGFEEWEYTNEYRSPIIAAIAFHPYIAPYDSTGNWIPKEEGATDSPLPSIDLLNKARYGYNNNAMVFAQITPIKGLVIESRVSSNLSFGNSYNFAKIYSYGGGAGQFNNKSSITRGMSKYFSYQWQNLATYSTTIMKDYNFLAMAGFEVGESEKENMEGYRERLLTEEPEMWYFDAGAADSTQTNKGAAGRSAGYSYLGRINLDWKSTVLFQVNMRKDYSSKFGPDMRSGTFPGYSVGLKFTEFDIVKDNLPFLSFGKLRYSYGKNGNNAIPDNVYYATVGVYESYSYGMGNTASLSSGAAPNILANKAVQWEAIVGINYGLDLTMFNNKLNFTTERFERYNEGMLLALNIPGYAGWVVRDSYQESHDKDPRPSVNIGEISNKGWETSIGWKDKAGDLTYGFDFNYTYVKNICEKLSGQGDSVRYGGGAKGIAGSLTRTYVGGEISEFYGYQVEGIFQLSDTGIMVNGKRGITNQPYTINGDNEKVYAQKDAQPGDFKFKDVNNDGLINEKDIVALGNPNPKHLIGFNVNLEYGWFDFNMFWQGSIGNKVFNATKYYQFNNDAGFNWNADYINDHYRETDVVAKLADGTAVATFPANTSAKYPRLDPLNKNSNFGRASDFYVEDASYLKLRNIQIGISLPQEWLSKIKLSQMRFYVGAKNLLTFTNYSGMDPEVPNNEALVMGIDKAAYPQPRMFITGVTVKF